MSITYPPELLPSPDEGQEAEVLVQCDGCGAFVPIDSLSLVIFTGLESFACEECKRGTVVVSMPSERKGEP